MERLSVDRLKADEKLIEVVKRFPCLWEVQSKSFRDLAAKESAWKVISAEVRLCARVKASKPYTGAIWLL